MKVWFKCDRSSLSVGGMQIIRYACANTVLASMVGVISKLKIISKRFATICPGHWLQGRGQPPY